MEHPKLPPLAFLPAVEAAGRLGSFKAAAEELHVTPSAISQQIKAVEEALGAEIFERRGRAIVPTARGELYLQEVRQTLRELCNAGERMSAADSRQVFCLDMAPFVAHEFVLPRFAELTALMPGVTLRIETSMSLVDFRMSAVDAAIRVGNGLWPGVVSHAIGPVSLALVCSPALAASIHELSDLADHTLIEIRSMQERGLANALRAQGLTISSRRTLSFESYFETVTAAEHGLGVAMGLFPLTTNWVSDGRLAVPLALRSQMPGMVALVHRPEDKRHPYAELASWLKRHYEQLPALPPGRLVRSTLPADNTNGANRH